MTTEPIVYADDNDAAWTFTVNRNQTVLPGDIDWADPKIALDDGDYEIPGEWLDDPAPVRRIKVPLSGLSAGTHTNGKSYDLYLQVPGGTDIKLGKVKVKNRN